MVEHQSGILNKINEDEGLNVDDLTNLNLAEELAANANIPIHDVVVEDQPTESPPSEEDVVRPDLDTEDWLSKLREDEVFNADDGPAPRLHGLRRLAKPFILTEESKVNGMMVIPRQHVKILENTNGEGSVMSRHEELATHHFPFVSVTFHITLKDGRTFSDSADAYFSNCAQLGLFPTAVASARAEARCLRKVLGISQHAAEELVDKNAVEELAPTDDDPINSAQAKLVDKLLTQLDVTLKDLLENITIREVFSVEEMTTGEARKALRLLNELKKKAKKGKKK